MKLVFALVLVGMTFLPSCGGSAPKKAGYACPMGCEGDSIHEKPGSCSVCGMDLEKAEEK